MQNITSLTAAESTKSKELHAFAEEVRGKFFTGAAWIETLLSDIIAGYFARTSNDDRCFSQTLPLR